MIEKDEIDRVELKDYSIDEQTGRLDQRDVVTINRDGESWKMNGVPAGKEVDTYKVNNLVGAVDALTIDGVRPKPDGLTASLQRASGGIRITESDMISLQQHGFYFARDGRLVSNEGELADPHQGRRHVHAALRRGRVRAGNVAQRRRFGGGRAGPARPARTVIS
jgi:hypothetical protein